MNSVETAIKSHEGQSYIEVTSKNDAGELVYTHSAWVDNDPRLHEVLLQHAWCLNQRTGHLITHTPDGLFAEALAAQGDVPGSIPLPRCLAAAVAGGKKIKRVFAQPSDYRYEALTIEWERAVPVFTPELVGEPPRTLMVSPVQSHAVARSRQTEAKERRELAEQRAQARHFKNLGKETARKLAKDEKVAGQATADACRLEAEIQLRAATARGEPWAVMSTRALAGHAPDPARVFQPAPEWYNRLRRGVPILVSEVDAVDKHPQRYARSQAAFAEFCTGVSARLSRRALRGAWVKKFPQHDWVDWNDSEENPDIPMQMEVAARAEEDRELLKLPAPAPGPLATHSGPQSAADLHQRQYQEAKRREEERKRAIADEEAQALLITQATAIALGHTPPANIEAPRETNHEG